MHRRCIGCEENTRLDSSPRIQPQLRSVRRFNKPKHPHLLVRPGSHLPAPAVRFSTARRARPSQCWPPLRRPPAGLGIDRPSTVLRLQKAVAIIGTGAVQDLCFLRPRSSPVRAETRAGQAGLGRAANARRAIERSPRPFGEEPPEITPSPKRVGIGLRRDNQGERRIASPENVPGSACHCLNSLFHCLTDPAPAPAQSLP